MSRFVALRELKEAAGVYSPGDFVLEAENCPHYVVQSLVNVGDLYDLRREFRLKEASFAAHQREKALLDDIAKTRGLVVVDDPNHVGWKVLIQCDVGQRYVDVTTTLKIVAPSANPIDHKTKPKAKANARRRA